MEKTCTVCGKVVVYELVDELTKEFRLVNTHTGSYHRNTCRACENTNAQKLRKENYKQYNYRAKNRNRDNYDSHDFGEILR